MDTQPLIADRLVARLSPYLGQHNARVAVKTFASRAFNLPPEALTANHVSALLDAMKPMLCTLVGSSSAAALLSRIRQEVP